MHHDGTDQGQLRVTIPPLLRDEASLILIHYWHKPAFTGKDYVHLETSIQLWKTSSHSKCSRHRE